MHEAPGSQWIAEANGSRKPMDRGSQWIAEANGSRKPMDRGSQRIAEARGSRENRSPERSPIPYAVSESSCRDRMDRIVRAASNRAKKRFHVLRFHVIRFHVIRSNVLLSTVLLSTSDASASREPFETPTFRRRNGLPIDEPVRDSFERMALTKRNRPFNGGSAWVTRSIFAVRQPPGRSTRSAHRETLNVEARRYPERPRANVTGYVRFGEPKSTVPFFNLSTTGSIRYFERTNYSPSLQVVRGKR